MAQPIRVLHIVGAIHPGGMANFIMNLYEHIDRDKLQFDVAVNIRSENDYGELIESMGGHVYELPRLTHHPFKSLHELYCLVKNNHYKVVVRHTANALITPQLLAAKLAGAHTICHAHSESDPQKLIHKLGRCLMGLAADRCWACSARAGKWMYGRRQYELVHNAIDVDKFVYDSRKSKDIFDEFQITDARVYGNVANFSTTKNQTFLLKIYKELASLDPNAVFLCVGEGDMRPLLEQEIVELGLRDRVILTGVRYDVDKFMSSMDLMILPSLFEGIPLTLIEAQAAGLPMLITETITKEVEIIDGLVYRESLDASPAKWAQKAYEIACRERKPIQGVDAIRARGYDINALAKWYQDNMLQMANASK